MTVRCHADSKYVRQPAYSGADSLPRVSLRPALYLARTPTATKPTPASNEIVLRMGEIGIVCFCSWDTWTGPRSTSFFWRVKLIPPMANPAIPRMMRRIPTIVAAFMVTLFEGIFGYCSDSVSRTGNAIVGCRSCTPRILIDSTVFA